MKKMLIVLLIITIVIGAVFAGGQKDENYGPRYMMGQDFDFQECFVDGEFSMELFLEHNPMVDLLDSDGDGIVDGTDTTVEDFILARIDSFPMQGGRRSNFARSRGCRF